jgi:hypothetical protein
MRDGESKKGEETDEMEHVIIKGKRFVLSYTQTNILSVCGGFGRGG